ncbi:Sec61beta family-domain-containing protein [Radiomyces spectabilis]|uniref:Sec61beta family-domain-containing protein n=1 Tax=Radiomyces spectabilis TaxID=64574 RepID=UPI002220E008|nr:Sec61beta family-domain-containing protein [Radiomyces spectabilis]KAI8379282.1 Sec61beta family-domain-containing protein [Radiomyces spectabilis]
MADNSTPKGTVRRRVTGRSNTNSQPRGGVPGGSTSSMMRIYSDDSPGLRVDPVVVLVLSLTFIASVFGLHIVGKFLRA